jgi:Zn finger protein HypA/HybF involved in hydrogenase expression
MGIKVTCPNGHTIKVKDSFAGKTGLCPTCKARISVPDLPHGELSEEAILGILEGYQSKRQVSADSSRGTSGDLVEQYVSAKAEKKRCQNCARTIATETHICPHCHTYIAGLNDFD